MPALRNSAQVQPVLRRPLCDVTAHRAQESSHPQARVPGDGVPNRENLGCFLVVVEIQGKGLEEMSSHIWKAFQGSGI